MDHAFLLCCTICALLGAVTANYCATSPGRHEEYDVTQHICCAGKLEARSLYSRCCDESRSVYDSSTSMCCGGVVQRLPEGHRPANWGCCNGAVYDAYRYRCCQGRKLDTRLHFANGITTTGSGYCCGTELVKLDFTSHHQRCCRKNSNYISEGTPYNEENEICCAGTIHSVQEGKRQCCGTKAYNPDYETCCKDNVGIENLIARTTYGTNECCKNAPTGVIVSYTHVCKDDNPVKRQCFRNDPIDTLMRCCYGLLYNVSTHHCCGGDILSISNKCCNRQPLPEGEVCCGRHYQTASVMPTDKNHNACCVTSRNTHQTYNDKVAVCKRRRVSPITLCNGVAYNPRRRMCCQGTTYRYSKHRKCCGNRYFRIKRTCYL